MPSRRSSAGASTRPRSQGASARNSSRGHAGEPKPARRERRGEDRRGLPRLFPSCFQTSQSAPCSSVTGSGSISPTPLQTSGPWSR